ncbi:MAG: Allergen V5/Tpx family protein [Acidimicrobiales bacterium]|nr:Allergen V5/Tpx family protein [Acidimicrobiales bacterium]
MRHWGIVGLISASALVVPIVTAAPAHAVCLPFVRCQSPTPTTVPPPPPPPVTPPLPAPPAPPPPPASLDPNQAATEFFDDTNAARADAGLAPLGWRADVAGMAVGHSAEMAQQGTIWHGSFVTDATLKSLNARSIGENVGMGDSALQVHNAFMNSPHHRDNILDAAFNQVGIGVIVSGGTLYVTEDFVQAKGGPVSARPTPVAHPAVKKAAAARAPSRVAAAPKRSSAPAPTSAPVTTAPPAAAEAPGVVTAVPLDAVPAAAPASAALPVREQGTALVWAGLLGAVLLAGSAGGHLAARRRRPT